MSNCKSCKSWSRNAEGLEYSAEEPTLLLWGVCARGESDSGEAVDKTSLVVAYDAEIYYASLSTHENFGCVLFQPKGVA